MHALIILAGTLLPLFTSLIVSAEWGKVWRSLVISALLSLICLAILIFIDRNDEGGLILIATLVGLPFIFGFSFVGAAVGSLMHKPRA
jgi:hypothetical protein